MPAKKQTYSEAYSKLEEILNQIENEELNVDDLAKQVKKATELIQFCKGKLFETEKEVEDILNKLEE